MDEDEHDEECCCLRVGCCFEMTKLLGVGVARAKSSRLFRLARSDALEFVAR